MADTPDPNEALVCDPAIEDCSDEPLFKNTIELNYKTPNMIVGFVTILNLVVPVLLYRYYFNVVRSAA